MKLNEMPAFIREQSNVHMKNLIDSFLAHFTSVYGYSKHEPVQIHSGIDSTVQFIGSHISVFKPLMLEDKIPPQGVVMSQPCVRTRNLKKYSDETFYSNWGSMFHSLGLLIKPQDLNLATAQTFDFMRQQWGLQDDQIVIRASANDADLYALAQQHAPSSRIETDTMRPEYYRHKLGIDGVWGRNFNVALKDKLTSSYADIGNVIILENAQQQLGIEIALGTSTVLKLIYGLSHVLDCHPLLGTDFIDSKSAKIRFEDCIITTMTLYHDGLVPSNKTTPSRLMKKYVEILDVTAHKLQVSPGLLADIITNYERREFGAVKHAPALLSYLGKE